jgi:hypothetical protein
MVLLFSLGVVVGCSDYAFSKKDDVEGVGETAEDPSTEEGSSGNSGGEGDDVTPDTEGSDGVPGEETGGETGDETGSETGGQQGGPTPDAPDLGWTPGGETAGDAPPDTAGEPDEDACTKAERVDGYLDHFQTPGDSRVYYCHRGGGPHYVMLETDISACLPHIDHENDVFPSTLCDS